MSKIISGINDPSLEGRSMPTTPKTTMPDELSAEERRVVHKAAWRIIPFAMFCLLLAFIDRTNIGFASLKMNEALRISPTAFGLAGGVFFVAYFLCEVPSNLAMDRFGARLWLARIMIVWGAVATATAFVPGAKMFLVLRFLLGAAEAGFFPGIILLITRWFPRAYRAQFIGWFTLAIPLSGVVGAPISAALLTVPHWAGLQSWQWLFIIEGVPSILCGIACLFLISDSPHKARWLSPNEVQTLQGALARDHASAEQKAGFLATVKAIFSGQVLLLALVLSGGAGVSAAYAVWLPRVVASYHWSVTQTGLWISALYVLGSIAMILFAKLSDHAGERRWHSAAPLLLAALCSPLLLLSAGFAPVYVLLALAVIGIYACKGPTWALATEYLPAKAKVASIAQVNALSNFTSFFTISLTGIMFQHSHSYAIAMLPLGLLCAAAGVASLIARPAA
jgi:MFS transporter, ACS family, tartrate transporter